MASHTALLVVHGIGAQTPGATLDKLARGLRRVEGVSIPQALHNGVAATIAGQSVRLYEVYWADLLMGDTTQGSFSMKELQSLSWFPWFNLRCGNYGSGRHSVLKLAWWCITLPIITFLVMLGYYGAGFLAQIMSGARGKRPRRKGQSDLSRVVQKVVGHGTTLTAIDVILDEYAGDVFSYVNSAGDAFYREKDEAPVPPRLQHVTSEILQRFYDQLLQADADGCSTIQIVAHSLGSVATYHALSGYADDPLRPDASAIRAAKQKIARLYTIGCPLEKIRFFWPRIMPPGTASGVVSLRWDNFVSYFDLVSGMVRSFEDWGPVSNHRLLGGGFFLGHVVYEHSPVFLRALTEGLGDHPLHLERTLRNRVSDWLRLTGEMLLAPAVVGVTLALGTMLYALVAMIIPFGISWVVRWFAPPEVWRPFIDAASLVLLGMMTLTFLVAPAIRASEVHRRYWVCGKAVSRQEV